MAGATVGPDPTSQELALLLPHFYTVYLCESNAKGRGEQERNLKLKERILSRRTCEA